MPFGHFACNLRLHYRFSAPPAARLSPHLPPVTYTHHHASYTAIPAPDTDHLLPYLYATAFTRLPARAHDIRKHICDYLHMPVGRDARRRACHDIYFRTARTTPRAYSTRCCTLGTRDLSAAAARRISMTSRCTLNNLQTHYDVYCYR